MVTLAKILDVVLLVVGGAAVWYAYKKGYLEDIFGKLGGGGAIEPAPEPAAPKAKEEAPKEEEKPKEEKKKTSTKKAKLALAFAGSHYDGEVLDTAYFVTTPSSFIPRRHENTIAMGVAIA